MARFVHNTSIISFMSQRNKEIKKMDKFKIISLKNDLSVAALDRKL